MGFAAVDSDRVLRWCWVWLLRCEGLLRLLVLVPPLLPTLTLLVLVVLLFALCWLLLLPLLLLLSLLLLLLPSPLSLLDSVTAAAAVRALFGGAAPPRAVGCDRVDAEAVLASRTSTAVALGAPDAHDEASPEEQRGVETDPDAAATSPLSTPWSPPTLLLGTGVHASPGAVFPPCT